MPCWRHCPGGPRLPGRGIQGEGRRLRAAEAGWDRAGVPSVSASSAAVGRRRCRHVPERRMRGFPRLVVGPHVGARRPAQPANPIRAAACGGADLRGLPVRAECLAFGIMVRDQYGIYGGLPVEGPTPGAEDRAGGRIPVRPERPTANGGSHASSARTPRSWRRHANANANAARPSSGPHASNDGAPPHASTGKAKAPAAATHTPPLRTPSSEDNPIQITGSGPIRTNHSGNPYTRQTVEPCTRGHGKPENH